ncbi:MAG: GTPase [Nanoarchaeota archaeon]
MPTNQGPDFAEAEKKYYSAKTTEEKILATEEMIKTSKKHKGTENLLALLRGRLKKLKASQEKQKKSGKSSVKTIKKEGFQVALIGLPNSGKSSLLKALTNANPSISNVPFTTTYPIVGMLIHQGVHAQIIDLPALSSEFFDQSLVNTADLLLLIVEKIEDIEKINSHLSKAYGEKLIVITKADNLSDNELRKLEATIKAKRISGILISSISGYNLQELKDLIISKMNVIRIYTKEPGKQVSKIPIVLPINSTIKDVAESILKGFSNKVKETRVTGPSSKFPNQKVGLSHVCKDKDIVEFHTN